MCKMALKLTVTVQLHVPSIISKLSVFPIIHFFKVTAEPKIALREIIGMSTEAKIDTSQAYL